MRQEFIWRQESLIKSSISDEAVIASDENGLIAGGWFVELEELPPGATVIATAKYVKDNCVKEDDYCRIYLDI